jgi:hypothetical protein
LLVTEDLDREPGLVHNQLAVFAIVQMALQVLLYGKVEFAVEIIREFVDNTFAVQFVAPCRK